MDWKCQFCGKTVSCTDNEAPVFCPQCGKKSIEKNVAEPSPAVDDSIPKQRKIGMTIFLLIITLGIYSFFLIYSWVRTLNCIAGKKKYNPASFTALCVISTVLCVVFESCKFAVLSILLGSVESIVFLYIVFQLKKETTTFRAIESTVKKAFNISVFCVISEFIISAFSAFMDDESAQLFLAGISFVLVLIRYGKVQTIVNYALSRLSNHTIKSNAVVSDDVPQNNILLYSIWGFIGVVVCIFIFSISNEFPKEGTLHHSFFRFVVIGTIVCLFNVIKGVILWIRNKVAKK